VELSLVNYYLGVAYRYVFYLSSSLLNDFRNMGTNEKAIQFLKEACNCNPLNWSAIKLLADLGTVNLVRVCLDS
jgi:hypothetical protein